MFLQLSCGERRHRDRLWGDMRVVDCRLLRHQIRYVSWRIGFLVSNLTVLIMAIPKADICAVHVFGG